MVSENILIATIGIAGAVIGSVATLSVEWLRASLSEKAIAKRHEPQKKILKTMLESSKHEWRKLDTLMHVIGADEETTKRLLLEIGARASENGTAVWGLVEHHPLPS
jgi:enoyl-[acyl-carrier-protein] reductase (NADH)